MNDVEWRRSQSLEPSGEKLPLKAEEGLLTALFTSITSTKGLSLPYTDKTKHLDSF